MNVPSEPTMTESLVANLLDVDNTIFQKILQEIDAKSQKTRKVKKFACLSLSRSESKKRKHCEESTDELFPGTLGEVNVTGLIMGESQEFDAFRKYLGDPSQKKEDVKLSQSGEFTQLLEDSQVRKKIESAITTFESEEFKVPEPPPVKEKEDINCEAPPQMFNTQYRQEVNNLFEQIETSICLLGNEPTSEGLPDKVLDIIFEEKEGNVPSSVQDIDWTDDTLLNAVGMDASFGTAMKQALLGNASKIASLPSSSCFNGSIFEGEACFKSLGPYYGLPTKVKQLVKEFKGIDELYDWQDECLNLPAIKERKNLIYALPTSGGKTLVSEILILREIMCYKRNALFVLPYVAIVQEKVWALSPFGVGLDFLVEEYAASKGTYPPRKRRRKNSVYIATIEKALNLINSLIENNRLNELGLVVVDELHLVGEEGRGTILESMLTKLMYLKSNIQIVGMSATIGNLQEICSFLNADFYTKNFRPVELTEYVKCGTEIARVNWQHSDENDLLVEPKKVNFNYSEAVSKVDPDMLGGLVMEVVPKGSCLVFCPTKKNCENVASLLRKLAKAELKEYKETEKKHLIEALKDESGKLCDILRQSVKFGIAYHHSGLTNDERRLIEEGFRAGIISVICCTSTLAAGVNLPAQRVILRSPYVGRDFINLSKYKQMVGRAGRAGLEQMGESILLTIPADLPKVRKLLLSPMNRALSALHLVEGKGLRHLLLSCISLGIANTRTELQAVSNTTLMAVQKEQLEVDVKKLNDQVIKNLFKMGALQESCGVKKAASNTLDVSVQMDTSTASFGESETATTSTSSKKVVVLKNNTKLVVSSLGSAAIKGGLELSRAHLLYEDLYEAQSSLVLLDCLHLLYLVTPYETAEQIRPNMQVYYDVLRNLGPNQLQTAKILGFDDQVIIKMLTGSTIKNIPERVVNRFYVSLMLYDLWNEVPVFEVSEKFQINRGTVQNLITNSSSFASNVVYFCEQLEEFWAFTHLLKGMSQRLSHCCLKELIPLMELPSVKESRAKQLYNAGYKNLQSIAKANVNDLVENIEFLPRRTAHQLIATSKMLLLERVENLREEAEDVLDGIELPAQNFNTTLVRNTVI